ncbi:MAG TPA: hypothetical protein VMU46_14675, partial [Burkholderiales bacterium]|nr:hypothetical protein [Burkholderiales bacterium]
PKNERADFENAGHAAMRRYAQRVTVARDQVTVELAPEALNGTQRPRGKVRAPCIIEIPIRLKTRGGETLIVVPNDRGDGQDPAANRPLIKALGQAWKWRRALERQKFASVSELARHTGCTEPYVAVMLRLAYLAPDIIEAFLNGTQPVDLTLARIHKTKIPLDWPGQRLALGFGAH